MENIKKVTAIIQLTDTQHARIERTCAEAGCSKSDLLAAALLSYIDFAWPAIREAVMARREQAQRRNWN